MQYFSGLLSGILLTILVLFLIDQVDPGPPLVNWSALTTTLDTAKEEVRQDVHEATAPEGKKTPATETR